MSFSPSASEDASSAKIPAAPQSERASDVASPAIAFEPLPAWAKSLVFSNRFEGLGTRFFTRLAPTPLPDPRLAAFSPEAAALIGIDPSAAADPLFAKVFTGNALLQGMSPLASVYSGHQFGVWAGQLGDGRAILLGEAQSAQGAGGGWQGWEIQLKGAGLTPYSRMGDGRAVLRSSIREFLCSEAMAGLGIPTTRALALTASDQPVIRETVETAAVATRMAPSFIRFGHFEHFAARRQFAELRQLADFVIDRFFRIAARARILTTPCLPKCCAARRRWSRTGRPWASATA